MCMYACIHIRTCSLFLCLSHAQQFFAYGVELTSYTYMHTCNAERPYIHTYIHDNAERHNWKSTQRTKGHVTTRTSQPSTRGMYACMYVCVFEHTQPESRYFGMALGRQPLYACMHVCHFKYTRIHICVYIYAIYIDVHLHTEQIIPESEFLDEDENSTYTCIFSMKMRTLWTHIYIHIYIHICI